MAMLNPLPPLLIIREPPIEEDKDQRLWLNILLGEHLGEDACYLRSYFFVDDWGEWRAGTMNESMIDKITEKVTQSWYALAKIKLDLFKVKFDKAVDQRGATTRPNIFKVK